MKYLSVCSGIEAATAAWHDLGFEPVAFSEIEPFPSAVLKYHYPEIPNMGDMTKFKEWPDYAIDILVGGTPCQSFSVAGLRKGLEDPRGNLMLTFLGIADRYKPRWIVWENVPGVLSSGKGRDFGTFLGALAELGYGFAYRVLDAQYFGVAQRRRRVFVVGYLGDYRRAAKVLFESESLRRDNPPSRKKGQEVTETSGTLASSGGGLNRPAGNANELDFCVVSRTLTKRYDSSEDGTGCGLELIVSPALRAKANASHRLDTEAYVPDISPAIKARDYKGPSSDGDGDGAAIITAFHPLHGTTHALGCGSKTHGQASIAIAFTQNQSGDVLQSDISPSMGTNQNATGRNTPKTLQGMSVRRLTPRECERLQGFPDDYTLIPMSKRNKKAEQKELTEFAAKTHQENIKWSADGPRYKALGNSMAVPVMRWIGERLAQQVLNFG